MPSTRSETGTLTSNEPAPLPATSTPHGATGVADSATAVAWLLDRKPAAVDTALASRLRSLGVSSSVSVDTIWREDGTTRRTIRGVSLTAADPSSISRAIAAVDGAMTPAPTERLEQWIATLGVRCKARRRDETDTALLLSVYAAALRGYPADVAQEAVMGRRWEWFPALDGELLPVCDDLVAPRRALRAKLAAWRPEDAPAPEKQRVTPDRAREIMAQALKGKLLGGAA